MHRAVVIRSMLSGGESGGLEPEILVIDRILQRWAVSIGTGLPSEVWDDSIAVARPPPLDDDCAILVDRCILGLPARYNLVINLWYRKPIPTRGIAKRLNLDDTGLLLLYRTCLWEIRNRLIENGNRALEQLLLVR
jgi:hypothetical protein